MSQSSPLVFPLVYPTFFRLKALRKALISKARLVSTMNQTDIRVLDPLLVPGTQDFHSSGAASISDRGSSQA
jgi:hypothetical protein